MNTPASFRFPLDAIALTEAGLIVEAKVIARCCFEKAASSQVPAPVCDDCGLPIAWSRCVDRRKSATHLLLRSPPDRGELEKTNGLERASLSLLMKPSADQRFRRANC